MICEQLGHEPDPEAMPLDITDFPPIVSLGVALFNNLRDHYIPGEVPIYTGKDLTALPVLFDIYEVTSSTEKEFLLRVINILDTEAVKASQRKMKKTNKPKVPDIKPGSRTK